LYGSGELSDMLSRRKITVLRTGVIIGATIPISLEQRTFREMSVLKGKARFWRGEEKRE
jgi:hypothetical protein